MATKIKAESAPIREYLAALQRYADHEATHEGATETAFSNLLAATAKPHGWTLIPKKRKAVSKKVYVFPDGTLQDVFRLARGYWEAKDTDDDLDAEIQKKIGKKYPLTNTIFEDTQRAVLFQNAKECQRYDLRKPGEVADLLNRFYDYTEPDYLGFDEAIGEFKVRMPELGAGLAATIAEAHKKNKKFQAAFAEFFELCQAALNPDIRQETVDEMLVQHLLTERLFRTIFQDDEFTRRNVIAAEVEKVIDALVSSSFSRADFLKALDKFYKAIEHAADTMPEFQDKQHFLNTVYERFFQGYCVKTADTHGIIYTPQPIADFMCASVVEVLKTEFGLTLGSPEVKLLDPCTGTGNFVVNMLKRVPKKDLERVYSTQFFANEVMLLPYYIAALNIERAYFDITGEYKAFEGLCFVDTLDMIHEKQPTFLSERNTARVQEQKKAMITVVIGNPPYNFKQLDDNDNNKNREYPAIEKRIKDTYFKASKARNKLALNDAYVKFFRWAIDRLGSRNGIVCFVTNNSFLDQIAFDGMRLQLMKDFTKIYHLNLQGNVRHNPTLSGSAYNVFGIQVGVGITIAIKSDRHESSTLNTFHVPIELRRAEKLDWLANTGVVSKVEWLGISPSAGGAWVHLHNEADFSSFTPIATSKMSGDSTSKAKAIFSHNSNGVKTHRDSVVYDFSKADLEDRTKKFVEFFNAEVDRLKRAGPQEDLDNFVDYSNIKWSHGLKLALATGKHLKHRASYICFSHYRPFCSLYLYFDRVFNDVVYQNQNYWPASASNVAICATGIGAERPFATLPTKCVPDLNFFGPGTVPQWFPFYVYDTDGSNQRENITDWSLKQFRKQYADKKITKWDIFYYVYGVLHHPGYRTKFADNLKKSLPRIPYAPDFRAFANAGKELAALHLDYEKLEPHPLQFVTNDKPLSYRIEKMKLSKDTASLRVNDSLTLAGIPPEVYGYRLGNRSALHWIIDQYQVSVDKRSGIVSDPNREDEPEYIVRLIGQVVKVSSETVRIVKGLPVEYAAPSALP